MFINTQFWDAVPFFLCQLFPISCFFSILFLDEPTSGLDIDAADELMQMMAGYLKIHLLIECACKLSLFLFGLISFIHVFKMYMYIRALICASVNRSCLEGSQCGVHNTQCIR